MLEGYRFDLRAIDAFEAAQRMQDASHRPARRGADTTWGAALTAAENISENCSAQVVTS